MKEISERFKPFEDWSDGDEELFGLCVKDGKIYNPPIEESEDDDSNYQEVHVSLDGPDIWRIDYATSSVGGPEVYWGQIPDRQFFKMLMKNMVGGFDIDEL